MFNWFIENIGTICVALLLILLLGFIVRKMIKDKKSGKTSCGCNCASCGSNCTCHKNI